MTIYNLKYSFSYLEPDSCSMSSSNCCFLTWYRFLKRHVKWSGIPNSFRISEYSTVYCDPHNQRLWHSQAEIDVFLELFCFFNDPSHVGNLVSGSSAFSKCSLNIWKFTVQPTEAWLENFEHYFASVWDQCDCAVVWAFFGIAFLWDWNENWHLPVLWLLLSFPDLLVYRVQLFQCIIF